MDIFAENQTGRDYLRAFFGVIWRGATYRKLAYLLAAFPLGMIYFIVLVTGISTGLSMAPIGIGLLVLLLTMACWWGFAIFERALTMWWLGVTIAPMSSPPAAPQTLWQRIQAMLRNPVTWKSLVYLFLDFPFGIFAFTVTVVLLSIGLYLFLLPLAYIIGTALYNANPQVGAISLVQVTSQSYVPITGVIEPGTLAITFLIAVLGLFLTLVSLHILNGIAFLWGQFARLMLGMSDSSRHLAEARAVAAHERARAEQADQTRRELIVSVSHELRTPISSIRGHTESLLTPEGQRLPEEERQKYLGIVARESERLGALVDDLLALARADSGELKLAIRPVSVEEVITEAHESLAPLAARERQVTLVRNVAPGLPPVMADRDRLVQVLLNLMRNAITYTPEGGIVSIAATQVDPSHVVLSVSDTGSGIAPADLPHVFDRFYRTDASRSRATGGFGLGLSIVRDLVEAMGGTVSVSSTLGEGSQFWVTLRALPGQL